MRFLIIFILGFLSCSTNLNGKHYIVISNNGINIRTDASLSSKILISVPKFTIVQQLTEVIKEKDGYRWIKIFYDKISGWVAAKFIREAFDFFQGKTFSIVLYPDVHDTIFFNNRRILRTASGHVRYEIFIHISRGIYYFKGNRLYLRISNNESINYNVLNKKKTKQIKNTPAIYHCIVKNLKFTSDLLNRNANVATIVCLSGWKKNMTKNTWPYIPEGIAWIKRDLGKFKKLNK